jgi:hypothetical protein
MVMTKDTLIFLLVVGARFIIPLFIPRFPLPAVVAALVLDAADQTIFQQYTTLDLAGYQTYDKALDIYYLTIAYISTMRNWGGGYAFGVAQFLWYYRLVGVVLFEFTQARWLLLVFPNTFEYYFIAIEAYKTGRNHLRLTKRQVFAIAGSIWVFIKLPQEYWIHIAKLDFTNFVKGTVLGLDPTGFDPVSGHDVYDQSWGTAIGNRPFVAIGIVVLIIAALAGIRILMRRLPERGWKRTFDADVQGRHIGWEPPAKVSEPLAVFGWPFFEKAALASMVAMIFANILPGVQSSALQITIGTTITIAVSTVLSEWLAKREVSWRSTGVQLAFMIAANFAIVLVFYALLGSDERELRLGNTLFFVTLLTLIVVLFDRYRDIGLDHQRSRRTALPAEPA